MDKTETIGITAIGLYDGHVVKKNKLVVLKFKFSYDERINMIKAIAFVGQNVKIIAKIGSEKAKPLGIYNFQELKIDRDGQAMVTFSTELEYVENENLSEIVGDELLKIRMSADVIVEDNEDEE